MYQALATFCAPLRQDGITADTFTKERIVYQIGVAPVRVDICTHIDGVTFDAAWPSRVPGIIFGEPVSFISLADLIANKQSAGRPTDLDHLRRMLGS